MLVGNILCVVKTAAHITYVLDDSMGLAVHVHIWNVAGERWPEQHQLIFVIHRCCLCYCHRHGQANCICFYVLGILVDSREEMLCRSVTFQAECKIA